MSLKLSLLFAVALLVPQLTRADLLVKDGQKVAFLGDSITAQGWEVPGGYVKLVTAGLATLGVHITPIPAGVGGNTSRDMLARLDHDVLSKKPDWMTLSCGVNDVWHHEGGVSLEDYKKNITSILDQCKAANIQVLIMTATFIQESDNDDNQKLAAYNDWLRETAKARNLPLAEENGAYWAAIKAAPLHQGNLITNDGVHPNPVGHQIMASTILEGFGATPVQVAQGQQAWVNMPDSAFLDFRTEFSIGPMTIGEYRKLVALADANNHTPLVDYCNNLFVGPLGEAFVAHANDNPPASRNQIEADARQRFIKKVDALPEPPAVPAK
jgi:lysophospholipase L1-like esterase